MKICRGEKKHTRKLNIGKRFIVAAVLGLMLGILAGCAYSSFDEYLEILGIKDSEYEDSSEDATTYVISEEDDPLSVVEEKETVNQDFGSQMESFYKQITGEEAQEDKAAREAIGLTEESIEAMKKEQEGNYAYDKLTEAGKTLYVEILTIVQHQAEDILVSTVSDDAVKLVFDYVFIDHPEIFWVDGYTTQDRSVKGVVNKITFTGRYTCDMEEVEKRQKQINEYVNKCLADAPSSDDEYFAIKYVYDYIIDHTEYVSGAPDNQNICSVFINGKSVCNGYAKATQYLLNKLGIQCIFVSGTVPNIGGRTAKHAWNIVRCNDAYYYIDTTWGDSSFRSENSSLADSSKMPPVNYDYLCVTTDEISKTHTISDIIRVPECNSMADNYYVREDEYFKNDNLDLVKDLFDRRYKDGSDYVTIKCATQEVYDSLFEKLINDRKVFDYLKEDTHIVDYTTFQDSRTIIVWING